MAFGRRMFLSGALALGSGLLIESAPPEAEALTALRAKISWTSTLPRSLGDRPQNDDTAYAFWRDGIITRQSNLDFSHQQVLTSTLFSDTVRLVSSLDIPKASIRVHQPSYGVAKSVQATVSARGLAASTDLKIDPRVPEEPAIFAGQPIDVTIFSRIPVESQVAGRALTPRVFTSIIQVVERVGTGTAWRTLNKPVILRTELQGAAWATANGKPTPTPIARG